jgi:hypothetical protein
MVVVVSLCLYVQIYIFGMENATMKKYIQPAPADVLKADQLER